MKLLQELSDKQIAGAFIQQDPVQRRQDDAMTPDQLAQKNAQDVEAERSSNDPLDKRIAALRQQLAQLIMQRNQQQKAASQPQQSQPSANPAVNNPTATGT